MILTIKGADFSSANIGTLSTYIISRSIGAGATFDIPTFVDKNSSVNWTITLDEGYTFGAYSVTMGSEDITPTVVDNVMTISIAEVTGNVRIVVATVNEYENVVIAWENGALDTATGENNESASNSIKQARIRTRNFLKLKGLVTITVADGTEMCPIYIDADGNVTSPAAYQTTQITVNSNTYSMIRLMIRKKSNPNAVLTPEFGNNVTVTGSFTEIPYEQIVTRKGIPALSEDVYWTVGAIDANTGLVNESFKTRIHSTRIPLTNKPINISVSGDAEMCPVWYNETGYIASTPNAYQTEPITTTVANGHSIALMVRNKTNTNQTLTTDFGANIIITKQ